MAQKALVSLSEQWINDFRKILKLKIGKNWTVYNSRGNVRLQVGKRPNEETLTTAYKWSEVTWIDALNRITTIHQMSINTSIGRGQINIMRMNDPQAKVQKEPSQRFTKG